MKKKATVIGEGAWGTAVAMLLASNNYEVMLWCHDEHVVTTIKKNHSNDHYLPGFTLSQLIIPTHDMRLAMEHSDYIFEAIPVKYLRSVITDARTFAQPDHVWISLSKGIEVQSLQFPAQIIQELVGRDAPIVVVAGPSFAQEVAQKKITALTIASKDCEVALCVQKMLANSYIKPYTSTDVMGTQIGSALKNVISLGIGIADGSGLSENSKAFIFTRGLREIMLVTQKLGGRQETIMGLSGIGDLVMSAFGSLGRNRACGKLLGQGKSLSEIEKEYVVLPESINTTRSLYEIINKHHLNMPVCVGIYRIVFENGSIHNVLADLMEGPSEQEC